MEFLLTVKAPRALIHAKRLYGPERWLARIPQGMSILGPKRGVLLVQLPPLAAVDHARLAFFLERVPDGLQVCIEFRNETWLQDSTFGLLKEHKAAYFVMIGARLPCVLRSTAPFVYARLHYLRTAFELLVAAPKIHQLHGLDRSDLDALALRTHLPPVIAAVVSGRNPDVERSQLVILE
jgi:uncharacterized protein YecE (DUF72 family)